MPLFRSKFQPKKSPARRSTTVSTLRQSLDPVRLEDEFGLQVKGVRADLGSVVIEVRDGEWTTVAQKRADSMTRNAEKLESENNKLRLQVEILLDMVGTCCINNSPLC